MRIQNIALMNIKHKRRKGIILALLSALGFANVYFFSKSVLDKIPFPVFGFYWFGFSFIFLIFWAFLTNLRKDFEIISYGHKAILIVVSLIEVISTVMFFYSIKLIHNPSIISFLTNFVPIFVAILSFIFLGERFVFLEYVGILIAVIGLLFLAYKDNFSFHDFFDLATVLALFSSFLYAVNSVLIKKSVKNISPLLFGVVRVIFLFLFFVLYVVYKSIDIHITKNILINLFLGSLLGPTLSILFSLYAYKYIEATYVSIIVSLKSLFTVIIIFLFMNMLPTRFQLIGGFLTLIGVIVMFYGKASYLKFKVK